MFVNFSRLFRSVLTVYQRVEGCYNFMQAEYISNWQEEASSKLQSVCILDKCLYERLYLRDYKR